MTFSWWILVCIAVVVGGLLVAASLPLYSKETPEEAATTIERFLEGELNDREWDAFLSIRARDPEVRAAKAALERIEEMHSCLESPTYLDEAGQSALRQVVASLRASHG